MVFYNIVIKNVFINRILLKKKPIVILTVLNLFFFNVRFFSCFDVSYRSIE